MRLLGYLGQHAVGLRFDSDGLRHDHNIVYKCVYINPSRPRSQLEALWKTCYGQMRVVAPFSRALRLGMIYYHTMAKAKVAVTIDSRILGELDALIAADRFPNRSQAIESALADKISRLKHARLAREAAKLNPRQEQAEADEGLAMDAEAWPEY